MAFIRYRPATELDACAIVGYFAFVNRIADGLGVEMEHS